MPLIKISINDDGEHWEKKISLFGVCVYHRHDFAKESEKKTVGLGQDSEKSFPEAARRRLSELSLTILTLIRGTMMSR